MGNRARRWREGGIFEVVRMVGRLRMKRGWSGWIKQSRVFWIVWGERSLEILARAGKESFLMRESRTGGASGRFEIR